MLLRPWRLVPLLGCGMLTACSCGPATLGALRVVVTVDEALPADCIELEVQSGGAVLASTVMDRTAGKTEYLVAALQGDLPASVDVQARTYLGRCGDRLARHLSGVSDVAQGTFPKTGINEARVTVALPDTSLDADQDHYIDAAQGGVDCDDTNALVHPFQPQACVSPLDTDCDGRVGCDDSDCSGQPACQSTPTQLAFSPSGITVHANDCSAALTLEVRNPTGLSPVRQQTTMALVFSGAPLKLFTDAACTGSPATQVVLPFGSSTQALYARGAVVGSATVTASAPGLTSASAVITVDAQPVAALAFTNPARSISASGCSAELTVQAQDAQSRPTTVSTPMALALSGAPSQGLAFFDAADSTCSTARTGVSIPPGADSIGFRVSGTRAGVTQLFAAGGLFTAQQGLTIVPGVVSGLGFSTAPPGVQSATCSPAPVTVQLQDAWGNAATTAAAATITLSVLTGPPGGVLTYYPAAGCASGTQSTSAIVGAGQSSVSVYIMGSAVGAYTMRAAYGASSATQQATISTGPPDHLAFVQPAVTATSGVCSPLPVRVQALDVTNVPSGVLAPLTVTLAESPAAAATLYSDNGCVNALPGGNTLSLALGTTEASFYFKGTQARTFRVDATAPGFGAANQDETILPGAPNALVWNPSPTALSADAGTCAGPFSLDVMDLNGNPTSFGAVTALTPNAASSTVGATLAFSAASSCTPTGASLSIGATAQSITFYATTTRAAAYTVAASTPSVSATGTASLAVGPAAPDRLALVPVPASSQVAGACLPVNVERRDAFGNPVPVSGPVTLNLSSTGAPALSFFATPGACPAGATSSTASISSGASTSFAVRGTGVGGPATVTVASAGLTQVTFPLSITAASASQVVILALPSTVTAGQCVAFTEQRQDQFGNLAPESSVVPISLSADVTAGATGLKFYTDPTCATQTTTGDLASGAGSRTLYFKSTSAGPLTIHASPGAPSTLSAGAGSTTVNADVARQLMLSAIPSQVDAGSCQPLVETIADQFGNAVSLAGGLAVNPALTGAGQGLLWFTDAACASATANLNVAAGQASRTLYFKAITAGALGITAQVQAQPTFFADPSVATTVNALTVAASLSLTVPATVNTNACTAFTVARLDSFGNQSPAPTVVTATLSGTGPPAVGFFTDVGCASSTTTATLASGSQATQLYLKATTVGALVVHADDTAVTSPLTPGTGSTNVVQAPVAKLVFTTLPGTLKAGDCSGLLTVEARDAANNPVVVGTALPVALSSSSLGALTFHKAADCTDGAPGAFSILAGSSTVQLAFKPTKAPELPTLTVADASSVGTGITSATQQWTVNPGDPTQLAWKSAVPIAATRYACTPVSLQVLDAQGNVATAAADVVTNLLVTTAAADVELFASSTCSGTAMVAPSATITAGTSVTAFGLVAFGTGSATLAATQTPAATAITDPAAATVNVTGAAGALSVAVLPTDIEAGACVSVTVARNNSASARVTWGAATTVTLVSSNPALISVHPDAACATAGATVDIAPGSGAATLYVRGHSSPSTSLTLSATEPSGRYAASSSLPVVALPLVRSGTCNIATGAGSSTCALTPPLPSATTARTFLVFQAQSTATSATAAHVECHLVAASPAVNVVCSRLGTGQVTVNYQAVSWGRDASAGGVTVQHLSQSTTSASANPLPIVLAPAVVPAESFVLFSSTATDANEHSNVFPTARLDGGTQLLVGNSGNFTTGTISAQVVDFAGAVVSRGSVANATLPYSSLAVTGLAAPASGDLTRSFTLHSVRLTGGTGSDDNAICKRRFSGYADSTTSLLFSRSAGANNSSACNSAGASLAVTELAWERVDLPGASLVQLPTTTPVVLANGSTGVAGNAVFGTAVEQHKTLFLLSGQGPGGQTAGEDGNTGNNPLSSLHALLSWNGPTSLNVSRLSTNGAADFYPYIIQFDP